MISFRLVLRSAASVETQEHETSLSPDNNARHTRDISDVTQLTIAWDINLHNENAYIEDKTIFTEAVEKLRQLRETRLNLRSFLDELDNKINAFEAVLTKAAFSRGILETSDDVLRLIFLEVCHGTDNYAPERLGHVCRRFREVINSLPSVWTVLHSNMHSGTISGRIRLSGEFPLSVSLIPLKKEAKKDRDNSKGRESTWDKFLEATIPHCHRWQSMYIDTDDSSENITAFLKHPGRFVPSVESLTIIYPRYEDDADTFFEAIHEDWEFPNVTVLRTKFAIPPDDLFGSMTECVLGAPHPGNDLCVEGILHFLDSYPALERLSITNLGEPKISGILGPLGGLPIARLPHLRFFSISNYDQRTDDTMAEEMVNLIDAIDMPNVEEISVTIFHRGSADAGDPLSRIFFRKSFPCLKRLSFKYSYSNCLVVIADSVLDKLPALDSLSLEFPDAHFFYGVSPDECVRNLRNLRFRHCHWLSTEVLQRLVNSVHKAGGKLEEIEIVDCPGVDANYAKCLMETNVERRAEL